jgi:sugar/nucleoside kinase (ribokinase family)
MRKKTITVLGELNVDIILNGLEEFPAVGKEVIASHLTTVMGSSAAIFACNISSLGAATRFIGKIGTDQHGRFILQEFMKKNINISGIVRDEHAATGISIIHCWGQDRAVTTFPGAMHKFLPEEINWDLLKQSDHLHISSIYLQPGILESIPEIFRLAKEAGLTTSLDMQWDPQEKWSLSLEKTLPYVDVFLPNQSELLAVTQSSKLEDAVEKLRPFINTLAVKQGEAGSLLIHQNITNFEPAVKQRRFADTIGAGDSFNAGFIRKFLDQQPLIECQRFGNLIGAISTTQPGGTAAFEHPFMAAAYNTPEVW